MTLRVNSLSGTFNECRSLNQPITITSGVTTKTINYINTFLNCTNFNQSINLPSEWALTNAFRGCTNMSGDIRITSAYNNSISISNMLRGRSNATRINVYFANLYMLNKTTATTSITGATMTWTATTNGYYNAYYNIYILNNVSS